MDFSVSKDDVDKKLNINEFQVLSTRGAAQTRHTEFYDLSFFLINACAQPRDTYVALIL